MDAETGVELVHYTVSDAVAQITLDRAQTIVRRFADKSPNSRSNDSSPVQTNDH
jgi:hypothetical protein